MVVRDSGPGFKTKNTAAAVRLMAGAKPGHVGIGLLIAQRVARLHGGTLALETAADRGSCDSCCARARLAETQLRSRTTKPSNAATTRRSR